MTPKEKAEELVDKFLRQQPMHITMQIVSAKQCALICINEKIKENKIYINLASEGYYDWIGTNSSQNLANQEERKYWQIFKDRKIYLEKIKQEIKKL